jgi:L-aspartate oxidase
VSSDFDVLIVGSGAAGLTAALNLAPGLKVGVIAKGGVGEGATNWAQGGIAAVLEEGDTFEAHVNDTMIAGAGLNDREVVEFVVGEAPAAIARLAELGVPFETEGNELHLTREGGHSHRRIVHVADATGRAIQQALEAAAAKQPNIALVPDMVAIDLITGRHATDFSTSGAVHGLYAYNRKKKKVETLRSRATILASGGAGRAYLFSTAPRGATGDGIAMAWRAGCRVANMEFIQFHPTCLFHPHARSFLISEAVRGEGGLLKLPDGTRFMPQHDARAELAPRDIVARAIDFEIKKHGLDCVYLDISHKPAEFIREHFPTIYARCLDFGIDMTKQPIPVVPAAHYTCGGVVIDRSGRTDVANLYAIGETSFTGLHGANRLASNSLLECLVFGRASALDILGKPERQAPSLPEWDESRVTNADEEVVISHNWDELRRFMWNYVGIVRTDKRLERAAHRIQLLKEEIQEFYSNFRVTSDLLELRNLVLTAELIVRSAQARKESRGLHYSRDYPETASVAQNTILTPATKPGARADLNAGDGSTRAADRTPP